MLPVQVSFGILSVSLRGNGNSIVERWQEPNGVKRAPPPDTSVFLSSYVHRFNILTAAKCTNVALSLVLGRKH